MNYVELKDNSEFLTDIPFSISFYQIEKYEDIDIRENASIYIFYIRKGKGFINEDNWKDGDLFIYPYSPNGIQFCASEDTEFYLIQNSPLLESMGVRPFRSLFKPKKYEFHERIDSGNIKKIFIKPERIETLHIKKNIFLLCISDCFKKVKSYLQQKEILWEKGKLIFIPKGNFITFYHQNNFENIFLQIE